MTTPRLRIGSVVLRVSDLQRQLAFWTAALDHVPREDPRQDRVVLHPREGEGPNLSLDARFSRYALPPRLHLDLCAHDQGAEVQRLTALGAAEIAVPKRPADAGRRLMEDPEGTPQRYCRHAASRRIGTGSCGPGFDVVQLPSDGLVRGEDGIIRPGCPSPPARGDRAEHRGRGSTSPDDEAEELELRRDDAVLLAQHRAEGDAEPRLHVDQV